MQQGLFMPPDIVRFKIMIMQKTLIPQQVEQTRRMFDGGTRTETSNGRGG